MQAIRSNFDFSFQGFGWFWVFGLMVYCFGKQKITLALLPHLPWDHDPWSASGMGPEVRKEDGRTSVSDSPKAASSAEDWCSDWKDGQLVAATGRKGAFLRDFQCVTDLYWIDLRNKTINAPRWMVSYWNYLTNECQHGMVYWSNSGRPWAVGIPQFEMEASNACVPMPREVSLWQCVAGLHVEPLIDMWHVCMDMYTYTLHLIFQMSDHLCCCALS